MSPRNRAILAAGVCAALAGIAVFGSVGWALAAPSLHSVGAPPSDLHATDVRIQSASGSLLHGWFCQAGATAPIVVLLHGVRADRSVMVGRALFLYRAGYSVLLFDLQAHGESPGDHITFGALEALDARSVITFLNRKAPNRPVAAIGTSLGGAALLLGPEPLRIQALILEQVYPTIEEAVRNRLQIQLHAFGPPLAPLLTAQLPFWFNVSAADLRPIERIAAVASPLLLIAGSADRHTTLPESLALFERAPEPKEMWVVNGAAHVDLHAFAPKAYEARVLAFLGTWLGHEQPNPSSQRTRSARR